MDQLSEIKVSYKTLDCYKPKITSGKDAFELILNSWDEDSIELQEEFKVLYLNRANEVLGLYPLSKGSVSGTVVDVRLMFAVALKCNASGIIVVHNHPSGNLAPSSADIQITKKIKECSKFMDISFIDHLIISKYDFYSFVTEGTLS